MKKIFTFLLLMGPFIIFGQGNLITTNAGFESATIDDGWKFLNSASGIAETTGVHEGAQAIKVTYSGTGSHLTLKSDLLISEPGDYYLSVWIKGTAGNLFRVIPSVNGSQSYPKFTLSKTDTWEQLTINFSIPSTPSTSTFNVKLNGFTADATYTIDNVVVKKAGSTIANGDMESGTTHLWSAPAVSNGASALILEESSEVHAGSKAMKIEVTPSGTAPSIGDIQILNNVFSAFNNSPKTISFWAKATPDNSDEVPSIMISQKFYDAEGKYDNGGQYNGSMRLTDNYRQYKWAVNHEFIDAGNVATTATYFTNTIRCGETAGNYYIDDITLETYTGTPTITSTPVTTADAGSPYTYTATSSKPGIGKWSLTRPETGAEWLTIDSYTGQIGGTPTAGGSFDLTITLDDGIATIIQPFTLVVSGATAIGDDVNTAPVKIYPNPASSFLFIESEGTIEAIEIYSIAGQKVLEATHVAAGIDISHLANGLYIVSANINGKPIQYKFTKQ